MLSGSLTHVMPSTKNLYWMVCPFATSTDATHCSPSSDMGTPVSHAPGAKSPRTSTLVSPFSGYVKRTAHGAEAEMHPPPAPPAPPKPPALGRSSGVHADHAPIRSAAAATTKGGAAARSGFFRIGFFGASNLRASAPGGASGARRAPGGAERATRRW